MSGPRPQQVEGASSFVPQLVDESATEKSSKAVPAENSLKMELQNDTNDLDRSDLYDSAKSNSIIPINMVNMASIYPSGYMQRRVDESRLALEVGLADDYLCNNEHTDEEVDALPKMSRVDIRKTQ